MKESKLCVLYILGSFVTLVKKEKHSSCRFKKAKVLTKCQFRDKFQYVVFVADMFK